MGYRKNFECAKHLIKQISDPTEENYFIIKFMIFCLATIVGRDTIAFMLDEWQEYNQKQAEQDISIN